jgi:hypothetical protein
MGWITVRWLPGIAGHGVVGLQFEPFGFLVVGAGFGDTDGIRAGDTRGFVRMRAGIEAGPRERCEGGAVQQAFDFFFHEEAVE